MHVFSAFIFLMKTPEYIAFLLYLLFHCIKWVEGRSIISGKFVDNHIDVKDLNPGLYMIKIKANGNNFIKKFIKI